MGRGICRSDFDVFCLDSGYFWMGEQFSIIKSGGLEKHFPFRHFAGEGQGE